MRYFQYIEPGETNDVEYIIVTEEEILNNYHPWWYSQMCKKFGKQHVDETYSTEDCIEDWMVVHWAKEITD